MDYLSIARSKVAFHRKELAEWEAFVRKAEELANTHGQQLDSRPPEEPRPEGKMAQVARLCKGYVTQQGGGGMKTSEFVLRLLADGVTFGKDAKGEVSSYLSRSKEFGSVGGLWVIKQGQEPAPEGGNQSGAA